MKKEELKAVMILNKDRQEDLAEALKMTPGTLSDKLNGKSVFRQDEIEAIALRYKLNAEEIQRIFFAKTVT